MSQTNYSLVSLDELKGAWGVTGFDESVDDARNVRALISALQEATRQVEDHCGVRFLPYLGSYRKELDGNLYGIGSTVGISPMLDISRIRIGERDVTAETVQITQNDDITGVNIGRVETLALRHSVGRPSETLIVDGVLGFSDKEFELPYQLAAFMRSATYAYNETGDHAETISMTASMSETEEQTTTERQTRQATGLPIA